MEIGRIIILCGIILVILGSMVILGGKYNIIGKMPGDLLLDKENIKIYFPNGFTNIIKEGTDTLKINLKWRLLNKNGDIKIIDLNIEGISLVIAQREEFQSFLANNDGNLDSLIEKIVSVSE